MECTWSSLFTTIADRDITPVLLNQLKLHFRYHHQMSGGGQGTLQALHDPTWKTDMS